MSDPMNDFMSEGFKRFPEAWDTITLFTGTLESQIRDLLEGKESWGIFVPDEKKKPSVTHGGWPGSGCWVCGWVPGRINGHSVNVEVGLWWNVPGVNLPLMAYAKFSDGPPELRRFQHKLKNPLVSIGTIENKTLIYRIPEPGADLTGQLDDLLETLLVAGQCVAPKEKAK